jgi:hypothetical protein
MGKYPFDLNKVSSQKSGVWGVLSWLRQLKTPHLPLFIEMLLNKPIQKIQDGYTW